MKTSETKTASITKSVGYSYPTSSNAERLGFGRSGCWTVSLIVNQDGLNKPPRAIEGFATLAEAQNHAAKVLYPWSVFCGQVCDGRSFEPVKGGAQ